MKNKVARRIQNEKESIWDVNIRLRNQYKPIDFSSGYPDFEPKQFVKQALVEAANSNCHQYAFRSGHARLRMALSSLYSPQIGRQLDALKEVLIVPGGHNALYNVLMTFVEEGDEVILIDPCYNAYESIVTMAGGRSVHVPLRFEMQQESSSSKQLKLDMDELKAAFSSRTKIFLLNTPHNPTGKVFTREEMETIATLCKQHDVICVVDEVYEFCVFEPAQHVRMCTLEGMWNRCITLSSAGKIFGVTGWKIGWIYGSDTLICPLIKFHLSTISKTNTPMQEALAIVIEQSIENNFFQSQMIDYTRKRDLMIKYLLKADFHPIVPEGCHFVTFDATKVLNKLKIIQTEDGVAADQQLVNWLAKVKGVLGIPITAFYSTNSPHVHSTWLRFCFVKSDETIEKAGQILASINDIKEDQN